MYILIMFIWFQGVSSLEVVQDGYNIYPIAYPTISLCEEQGELLREPMFDKTTRNYSWQTPKCVFVQKPS